MVRTILCHPVAETKVFSEYYDPTSVCCVHLEESYVVVGSKEAMINFHRIDKSGCPREHLISTAGGIMKLEHCSSLNYLLTLEMKSLDGRTLKGTNPRYVRVYLNWMSVCDGKYLATHKIGYTAASHNLDVYIGKFIILDFPMKYTARDVACCHLTGNIAIATETKLNLFACKKMQVNPDRKTGYDIIDFFPVAEIDPGIQLVSVSLSGPYLAFASNNEVRALEIGFEVTLWDKLYQAEEASLLDGESLCLTNEENATETVCDPTEANDGVALDDYFTTWDLGQGYGESISGTGEKVYKDTVRKGTGVSFSAVSVVANESQVTFDTIQNEVPYVDMSMCEKEVLGPKETIYGHPIKVFIDQSGMNSFIENEVKVTIQHTTLLYKRLPTIASTDLTEETGFHSLQFLPIFLEGHNKTQYGDFLSYPCDRTVVSLGLFISSQTNGFLYDALFKTRLLSVYNYTSHCVHAKLTVNSLFSITGSGLETYTVRLYASAARTCKDMVSEGILKVFPRRTESYASHSLGQTTVEPWDELLPTVSNAELQMEESYFGSYIERLQYDAQKETMTAPESSKNVDMLDGQASSAGGVAEDKMSPETPDDLVASPYPIYQIESLLKPCPDTNIEICLIGICHLRGLKYVGCTPKHVVLLVKACEIREKRGSGGLTRKVPWNMYILERREAASLARYLTGLIDGSEFANPMVYNQLLSEAMFFSYSALSVGTSCVTKADLKGLIAELAARAGDFFSRCAENYDFDDIGAYYSLAKLSLAEVLSRHMYRDQKEHLGKRYGNGIIMLMNSLIFEKEKTPIQLNEEQAEHLLRIYSVVKPCLLARVIQESNIKSIPPEFAVETLESFRDESSKAEYRLNGQDLTVLVILYLKLCNPEYAEVILKSMKQEDVINATLKMPTIIIAEGCRLTPFAQLLQRRFPGLFAAILKELIDHNELTLTEALQILGVAESLAVDNTLTFSPIACEFLEGILNDEKKESDYLLALKALLQQYKASASKRIIQDFGKGTHRHIPKGTGLFGVRYSWLDQLPPFSGDIHGPNDCINRKQVTQSVYESSARNSPIPFVVKSEERQDCPCCCCQHVLLKLQSILSSGKLSKEVASLIMSVFGDFSVTNMVSIHLICLTRTDQTEKAVELLVRNYVSLILVFTQDVLKGDKNQLRALVETILTLLKNNEYEQWNRDSYVDAVKGALVSLARMMSPVEFLATLPSDGALTFFLPYIRECLEVHTAKALEKNTLENLKDSTPEVTFNV